jgi:hypothetical protein
MAVWNKRRDTEDRSLPPARIVECHRGRVVIVDAENGEREIHRRVHTLGLPSEGVVIYETDGFDLRSDLYDVERALDEHSPDYVRARCLKAASRDRRPHELVEAVVYGQSAHWPRSSPVEPAEMDPQWTPAGLIQLRGRDSNSQPTG